MLICSFLNVYYSGSTEEFNEINVGAYNSWLTNAKSHYNYKETPDDSFVDLDSDKVISSYDDVFRFEAEGHSVTYQWYTANNTDLTDSVAISGENGKDFSPMEFYGQLNQQAKYKYFYCVATVEIDGVNHTVKSPLCINIFAFLKQGKQSYIDYENAIIYTDSCNNINTYDDIFEVENNKDFAITVVPSYQCGDTKCYGTGSTVKLSENNDTLFSVVVFGDVNGDSVADILDTSDVQKVSIEQKQINYKYFLAADTDYNGEIAVEDYAQVVNKVVSN